MDGRTRARIKRTRDTLILRENERQSAEDILKNWMQEHMTGASRETIGQADKLLQTSYSFHNGLCEAYRKAEPGSPLDEGNLSALKEHAKAFLNAEKAYDKQEEKLRACIMGYLRDHDTVQEIDSIINMLPACYLRFNLFERKFAIEEEKNNVTV